jgi:hypothetical protein
VRRGYGADQAPDYSHLIVGALMAFVISDLSEPFLKKKICFGWIRVEFFGGNGVRIKDAAINLAHNKPIACVQNN